MLSDMEARPVPGSNGDSINEELEKELELLLCEPRRQEASDWEGELNIYRSGSAPPTVEGSLTAVGGLFGGGGEGNPLTEFSASKSGNGFLSEEELCSDPAYLSYYYANMRLNPRLPPVMMSKEDQRSVQRLQAGSSGLGGIGDKRKVNRVENAGIGPLFSMQSGYNSQKEESPVELRKPQPSSEWLDRGDDGLIGLPGLGLGGRRKSLADIIQVFSSLTSICMCVHSLFGFAVFFYCNGGFHEAFLFIIIIIYIFINIVFWYSRNEET